MIHDHEITSHMQVVTVKNNTNAKPVTVFFGENATSQIFNFCIRRYFILYIICPYINSDQSSFFRCSFFFLLISLFLFQEPSEDESILSNNANDHVSSGPPIRSYTFYFRKIETFSNYFCKLFNAAKFRCIDE